MTEKQENKWENLVTESRITLVDNQDTEYEFIILEELEYQGARYLALVSCDEKTDVGSGDDPGEGNDIVVVRTDEVDGERVISAVTDAEELYALSKIIDEKFGHLSQS